LRITRQIISGNLKAGVPKACFREPMVNHSYADSEEAVINRQGLASRFGRSR
jgi:hypothetical protein